MPLLLALLPVMGWRQSGCDRIARQMEDNQRRIKELVDPLKEKMEKANDSKD
jgi:hypothetical protein